MIIKPVAAKTLLRRWKLDDHFATNSSDFIAGSVGSLVRKLNTRNVNSFFDWPWNIQERNQTVECGQYVLRNWGLFTAVLHDWKRSIRRYSSSPWCRGPRVSCQYSAVNSDVFLNCLLKSISFLRQYIRRYKSGGFCLRVPNWKKHLEYKLLYFRGDSKTRLQATVMKITAGEI